MKKENNIPVQNICTIDRQAHKDLLVDRFEDYLKQYYGHLNAQCSGPPGTTAGDLIRERILLEAKRLLTNADMTIAEIAYELNFQDNSYFNRFLKGTRKQCPMHSEKNLWNNKK